MEIENCNYRIQLANRWVELRKKNIFSYKNIQKQINRNLKIIEPSLKANFELWPVDASDYYDADNFEQEIALMLDFTRLRISQLDLYFTGLLDSTSN